MTLNETLVLLRALTGASDSTLEAWNGHPRVGNYKRSKGRVLAANGNCVLVAERGTGVVLHASIPSYPEPMPLEIAIGVLLGATRAAPAARVGAQALAQSPYKRVDSRFSPVTPRSLLQSQIVAPTQAFPKNLVTSITTHAAGTYANSIHQYFNCADHQREALQACGRFLSHKDWSIRDRLKLYDASHEAFRWGRGMTSFRKIYDELVHPPSAGGWGIARNASGPLWSAQRTFQTLKTEFSQFAWGGDVTLLSLPVAENNSTLLPLLENMRSFKPVSNWPVMAVSKVLHFYNPELFPVYDNEVIWKKVLQRFRHEFKQFCLSSSPPYDLGYTPIFYRNYLRWGTSLMSYAHPQFMEIFVEWIGRQPDANLPRRQYDAATLYATAFEFTIIGAYAVSDTQPLPRF